MLVRCFSIFHIRMFDLVFGMLLEETELLSAGVWEVFEKGKRIF